MTRTKTLPQATLKEFVWVFLSVVVAYGGMTLARLVADYLKMNPSVNMEFLFALGVLGTMILIGTTKDLRLVMGAVLGSWCFTWFYTFFLMLPALTTLVDPASNFSWSAAYRSVAAIHFTWFEFAVLARIIDLVFPYVVYTPSDR